VTRTSDRRRRAVDFVQASLRALRDTPFAILATWPEWPGKPAVDLRVPDDLAAYTFTLMKDTLHTGEVRIAIQAYGYAWPGMFNEAWARGFAVSTEGAVRPLSEEEHWDLT
jgi:hypothetical protein